MHTPSLSRGRSARGGREGRSPVPGRSPAPRRAPPAASHSSEAADPFSTFSRTHDLPRPQSSEDIESGSRGRSWSWSYGICGMRSDGREGGRRPPTRRSEHPARCLVYTRQRVCPSCMHGVPCTAQSLHRVHKTTCKPQYVKHAVHRTPQRIADSGVRACAIGAVYRSTACTRTHV